MEKSMEVKSNWLLKQNAPSSLMIAPAAWSYGRNVLNLTFVTN